MSKDKFLIKEYAKLSLNEEKLNELRELDKQGKPITVIGVIQRADSKNQNGRVYPYNILKKEVDRYVNEVVSEGIAMGQLDHIDSPVLELKNASHIIDEIWWDGPEKKDVYGKIRLLPTPSGDIAKKIVLEGIPLGISSRAVGSVSKNEAAGEDVVGEDLQLICWDLVGTPSTNGAFLRLHEGYDPKQAIPKSVRIKQALKDILKKG